MALHMPRTAASIQVSVPAPAPIPHHLIARPDGEVFWAAQNGEIEEPITRLKREEIVFILKRPAKAGGYFVYSLTERRSDEPSGGKPPFELSVLFAAQLPEEPLAEFLLGDVPAHLKSDGRRRVLDVVVSTRSGTGQAPAFHDGVLHPLLEALGLGPDHLGLSEPASRMEDGDGSDGYRFRYLLTVTKSSSTIRDFAWQLGRGYRDGSAPARTIVLLSGDGGVIDLLNGLDQSSAASGPPPTVTVLPLGTGNALFHSLHKPLYEAWETSAPGPSPLVLGLRTLFKGTAAPLPTFRATFSPRSRLISFPEPVLNEVPGIGGNGNGSGSGSGSGSGTQTRNAAEKANGNGSSSKDSPCGEIDHLIGAIVASYGFHASLVWESDTPAYRKHGDKRFGMAAAELLKISHAYDAAVEVRTRGSAKFSRLRGDRFSYVLATMVSNLERAFTISPAGRPLDGQLRLVHFGDVGGDKTMEIMMAAYRGGEHVGMRWAGPGGEDDGVGYDEIEEVRVTIAEDDPRWRKVCIDGTIVEVEKGGWMAVRRDEDERLRILVDRSLLSVP